MSVKELYENLTEKEKAFIRVYTNSEYMGDVWDFKESSGNGQSIWTLCHFDNMENEEEITRHASAGLLSSLIQKRIFDNYTDTEPKRRGDPDESTLWLTALGIEVAKMFIPWWIE